jgi:hypothetical protein
MPMRDPLATHVHDHLAGARGAVTLLEILWDQYAGEPLGLFAVELLAEVEADRTALQGVANRVEAGSNALKEAITWLGGKVSRMKFGRHANGQLGTFEALEALALGILGKQALWRALAVWSLRRPPACAVSTSISSPLALKRNTAGLKRTA